MQLSMRTSPALAEDLPNGDPYMITGLMGDCISIIVLWGFHNGRAQNVRGYHAFGGFGAINLASLFNGVPNAATTIVRCIFGGLAAIGSDAQKAQQWMVANYGLATTTYQTFNNARVDRHGNVQAAVGHAPHGHHCVIL